MYDDGDKYYPHGGRANGVPMNEELLCDFERFFEEYKRSRNTGQEDDLLSHYSGDVRARWTETGPEVTDWDYDDVRSGTEEAYRRYEGKTPMWHFEDILPEVTDDRECVAVFFVSFELDREFVDEKVLFTEAERLEDGEWKKIREYAETDLPDTVSA